MPPASALWWSKARHRAISKGFPLEENGKNTRRPRLRAGGIRQRKDPIPTVKGARLSIPGPSEMTTNSTRAAFAACHCLDIVAASAS